MASLHDYIEADVLHVSEVLLHVDTIPKEPEVPRSRHRYVRTHRNTHRQSPPSPKLLGSSLCISSHR